MKVKFLKNTFGNDEGDTVKVYSHDENEINYYDNFNRWCYLKMSEKDKMFEIVDDE